MSEPENTTVPLDEGISEVLVSTHEIKVAVCRLVDLKHDYAEKKEIAEACHRQVKEAEYRVIELLEKSGLDSFKVPNVGTATRTNKFSWQTPKDIESKKKFFKHVKDKLGDDGFWTYASVNSRSLQTYCSNALEEGDVQIDGLEAPVATAALRFTKARK